MCRQHKDGWTGLQSRSRDGSSSGVRRYQASCSCFEGPVSDSSTFPRMGRTACIALCWAVLNLGLGTA